MDGIREQIEQLQAWQESASHVFDSLYKAVDDVLWYQKLGDVAHIEKIRVAGPPPANSEAYKGGFLSNPDESAANNVQVPAYVFVSKGADPSERYPLVVFVHGGFHANFSSTSAHIVRELLEQGYVVVAPEYRGSTGYGEVYFKMVDYGGLEIEDVLAARNWVCEHHPLVDPERVGILGPSHGGLHALMGVLEHPEAYHVAYAGVPVVDLILRYGYRPEAYRELVSADYHIGKSPFDDPQEFMRRSPTWQAHKLERPLLIHTTTNDEQNASWEVEYMIRALQAAGKDFQYEIYDDAPGGHAFEFMDTEVAIASRQKVWRFLAEVLDPPNPPSGN